MKICNQHKVEFVHKVGTSQAGKAYDFWSCPQKLADGSFCQDKGIEPSSAEAAAGFEKSIQNERTSSFNTCNAMNNTIALIIGDKINLVQLEEYYGRLLKILEG